MNCHIFIKEGDLYLITDKLPSKPQGLVFVSETEAYNSALAKLKDSAIRVGNKDDWFRDVGQGIKFTGMIEGEIYEIECEVEYKEIPIDVGPGEYEYEDVAVLSPLKQEQPQHNMRDLLNNSEGRNWAEDYAHENGKYLNRCGECGHDFMGHKRRVRCRKCDPSTEEQPQESQDELWEKAERMIEAIIIDKRNHHTPEGIAYFIKKQLKADYTITRKP